MWTTLENVKHKSLNTISLHVTKFYHIAQFFD